MQNSTITIVNVCSTPLMLDLGDTLELICRNISNLFIQVCHNYNIHEHILRHTHLPLTHAYIHTHTHTLQTDQIQYDNCNASASSGVSVYNGFCFSGSSLRLTLRENSQNLDNTVNFENNQAYFLTSGYFEIKSCLP